LVKENEPKFPFKLGNLPDKADCKMILTLPRELMAKTNLWKGMCSGRYSVSLPWGSDTESTWRRLPKEGSSHYHWFSNQGKKYWSLPILWVNY